MAEKVNFRVLQNKVLKYALKNDLLVDIGELEPSIKWDFLLVLSIRNQIPKCKPINVDEAIISNFSLFLNWYLFEREYEDEKTIGELYVESEDFKEDFEGAEPEGLREGLRSLRSPLWGVFVVVGNAGKDEYLVRFLGEEEELLVHDKSSYPLVKGGDAFHGILYRFGGRCYICGKLMNIPKKAMERYYKTESLARLLEERFEEFIETKSHLSERTIREKEEMFYYLLHYVNEKGYTKLRQIERMNIDTWMRWIRRRFLYFSRSREDAYRRGARQFFRHLFRDKKAPKE